MSLTREQAEKMAAKIARALQKGTHPAKKSHHKRTSVLSVRAVAAAAKRASSASSCSSVSSKSSSSSCESGKGSRKKRRSSLGSVDSDCPTACATKKSKRRTTTTKTTAPTKPRRDGRRRILIGGPRRRRNRRQQAHHILLALMRAYTNVIRVAYHWSSMRRKGWDFHKDVVAAVAELKRVYVKYERLCDEYKKKVQITDAQNAIVQAAIRLSEKDYTVTPDYLRPLFDDLTGEEKRGLNAYLDERGRQTLKTAKEMQQKTINVADMPDDQVNEKNLQRLKRCLNLWRREDTGATLAERREFQMDHRGTSKGRLATACLNVDPKDGIIKV